MIKQKKVVPGALAAFAMGTLVGKAAQRSRRNRPRTHASRRLRGRGRW